MLENIKGRVYKANISLCTHNLVTLTWGNVSERDPKTGYIVIKPSGAEYDSMTPADMAVVDLDGNVVDGKLKPSFDTPTHLELYRQFPAIGGITHTHSKWATIFAQCGYDIPPLGTTHADTFYGPVQCTEKLTAEEIVGNYELETGKVIARLFNKENIEKVPAVLVNSHGPFTWGKTARQSVENAIVLEEVAMMAWHTLMMNKNVEFQQDLLDKHYFRKHGKNAYYGQQ